MKKYTLIGLLFILVISITGCGESAPKPSLKDEGIEEIKIEEIKVEEITWENSSTITRWD